MEAWAWLIAYLVGFAVLQLVLYRYFRRGESTHDGEREPGHRRLEQRAAGSDYGETDGGDGVSCRQCGTRNDRTYSYCRNGTEPLQ
jgi:hypothetical protein